jgi:TadE-like protein
MTSWRRTDGQAAVELVALLPLAALLVAGAWQLAVAGHAAWAADAAARAAARAAAVGDDARAAARRELAGRLGHDVRVRERGEGTVEVTVRIPPVLGLPVLGHTTATAHFRPQR